MHLGCILAPVHYMGTSPPVLIGHSGNWKSSKFAFCLQEDASDDSEIDANFDGSAADEEIDEDLAFTAEDEAKYGSWFEDDLGEAEEYLESDETDGDDEAVHGTANDMLDDEPGSSPREQSSDEAEAWLAQSDEDSSGAQRRVLASHARLRLSLAPLFW